MKIAIVIGATGLTGKFLTRFLLASDTYEKVVVFTRRAFPESHPKLINHVVDFDCIAEWSHLIQGDDLFSCMGTTIKQAGSRAAFYQVDYTYQANVIEAAAANGVTRLFLVSSPSASAKSPIFYNRVKGQLDQFAQQQSFATLVLFKPSIIFGEREDHRTAEAVGKKVLQAATRWIPGAKRFRPISGKTLAQAIVACAERGRVNSVYSHELDEIFALLDL